MQKSLTMARLLTLIGVCFSAVAACGQKGPLYLPGDPSQVQTELPAQLPEQSDNEDDDENGGGP